MLWRHGSFSLYSAVCKHVVPRRVPPRRASLVSQSVGQSVGNVLLIHRPVIRTCCVYSGSKVTPKIGRHLPKQRKTVTCTCFELQPSCCIIVSANWTHWMPERLFSFRVSVCLCVCLCAEALNANSSKMVKAADFKFDKYAPRDSPDITP